MPLLRRRGRYSEPRIFSVRDPNRVYAEMLNPLGKVFNVGRVATLRFKESYPGGKLDASMIEVIDGGEGYKSFVPENLTLAISSVTGRQGELRAVISSDGKITGVEVVSAGTDYQADDVIMASPPAFFELDQSIELLAKVNDPLSELGRVAFYVNGVELNTRWALPNGLYRTQYSTQLRGISLSACVPSLGMSVILVPNV